ncbi:nuclear transport factor 2 family protein [Novosphingobium flavum]|uniref:Nuclear transport factor 2 family protein n=1 Tax=Novosphingobium flavum TaxID=1778672 RepID=A0A7X1FQT8_9SPHN|nr:nuclear transport factor 2 family protein [Novosphingobium flavum]MBC2665285.1 nuclear transport factor 2 family protein [Novosphingobium flavum]
MTETAAPAGITPLTVEDRCAIHDLIAEYCHYEDSGDAAGWASLYTTDGRFVGGGNKLAVGYDALLEFATRRWADKPQVHDWVHWTANIVIRPTAEGAEARSFQMVVECKGDNYRIYKVSGKHDILRKENGQWRFYERRVFPLPFQ